MRIVLFLCLVATAASAADEIFLTNGSSREGRILKVEGANVRLEVPLEAPAGAQPMFASVAVARADIARIEFSPVPARDQLLRTAKLEQIAEVRAAWIAAEPWLDMPRSPAAQIGVALGDLMLRSPDSALHPEALSLFQTIEKKAWSEDDRASARQGRLRAMVASGQAREAIAEATEFAKSSENPSVLIAAKLLLAGADDAALRQLLADNPRWEEDVLVRPERERLYHHALDFYLYPYLFHGSEIEAASQGLWGATKLYEFVNDPYAALETARDIITLYPGTKYAALATDFVAKLPAEVRAYDAEAESREDAMLPSKSPVPVKSEKSPRPKPTPKKDEKPTNKKN